MRLPIGANLTARWVLFLRNAGHDVVHWSSIGRISAKDGETCDFAREHSYALLTNDLDFPRILAHTHQAAPSIVLLRGEPLVPETRGQALLSALQECATEIESGAIVTLDWSDQPRARVLPLR